MKSSNLEDLADLVRQAKTPQLTVDQIQAKVRKVFKKSIDSIKECGERPTLAVGKVFLENYHRDHGIDGMKNLLSKISLLVEEDGLQFLTNLGVIKRK